jgi:hypothetical protein
MYGIDYWPQDMNALAYTIFLVSEVTVLVLLLTSKLNHSLEGRFKYWPSFSLPWKSHLFLSQLMQIISGIVFYVFCLLGLSLPTSQPEWKCSALFKVASMAFVSNCFFVYIFLLEKAKVVHFGLSKCLDSFQKAIQMVTMGIPLFIGAVGYFNEGKFVTDTSANVTICLVTVMPHVSIFVAALDIILNSSFFMLFYIPLRAIIRTSESSAGPEIGNELEDAKKRNFETTLITVIGNSTAMVCITAGTLLNSIPVFTVITISIGLSVKLNTIALIYVTKNAWTTPTSSNSPCCGIHIH